MNARVGSGINIGELTCRNASAVDYFICTPSLIKCIDDLTVKKRYNSQVNFRPRLENSFLKKRKIVQVQSVIGIKIFQLYRGCQFYWRRKSENTIDLSQVIDCKGSRKSNYHTITTTTAPCKSNKSRGTNLRVVWK
jgi:hypothetical protein